MQLDPVTIQVLWNRLVSLVDEAATGLLRTAYTPSVKEYHDFCCALFDRDASMMSHSTITTAGFLGIVPEVMRNFVERHPPDSLKPGDVLITNDPWLASGHLIDVSVASPIFHHGELVGFTLCIVHQLDMGGRMSTLESQDVYEEGLKIPVLKLYDEGRLNETVFEFLRANIRVPDKVIGDVRAQLVANHVCTQGLVRLLDEFALHGLEDLSREVVMRTERSLRRKIAELPDGTYRNAVRLPRIPGCSDDIDIRAAVTVDGDGVTVDYTGSSGEVGAAVNCTLNMTRSYTAYPFKLALDPDVPNNAGGLRPIAVVAPQGTILNCRPPAATWGRTMVSQLLPEIMFGALKDVMPDTIYAANGGTPSNEVYLHGRHRDGRTFFAIANHMGGFGGRANVDGLSTLCFPNNTRNIPIEVTENEATVVYDRKEFVVDSAGPGRWRGGFGQEVGFTVLEGEHAPVDDQIEAVVRLNGRWQEDALPVFGLFGGRAGRGGGLWLNGEAIDHGVRRKLRAGDSVRFQLMGGGGYGDPLERDADRVEADVRAGLVSVEAARTDYGVVIDSGTNTVDRDASDEVRRAARQSGNDRPAG